ncbi:MAG: uroporphyrinogen decarboxylase family protein [Eubacteriales bacterium]|nr:uroporphyrinogen decarboxylase family protein [Eubacteriales bacterium]
MNSLERVTKIINHQEADRVPVYPLINSISYKYTGINYAEWTQDPEKCAESILKATDALDVDVICTLVDLSVEAADWGMKMKYPKNKAAGPAKGKKFIDTKEDYEKITVLDPTKTPRMSDMIKMTKILCDAKGQEKPIVAFVFGPLGILSMLRGLDNLMIDMFMDKEVIHKALRNITDTLIAYSDALIDAGAHAVMFDTLYSSQTIMSAEMWEEFEGPYIEELATHVHERERMVMIHNCGEGLYLENQIARMHPEAVSLLYFAADCKTMQEMKEKYGSRTTFIGQVDPGFMMTCTEEELRTQIREQIDAYKKDGGFILATGCEYPAPMDDAFAKVFVEEAKTYGVY